MTLKSTANFLQKLTPPIATQHVNKQAGGTLKSFIQCQAQGVPLLLFSDSPTPTQRELTDVLCPTSHHPSTQAKTHQQPPSCSGTLHQDCVGALCTYTAAQHSQRFLCLRQKNAPSLRANKAGLWKAAAELLPVSVQGFGFLRQSCQPWKKKQILILAQWHPTVRLTGNVLEGSENFALRRHPLDVRVIL